MPGDALIRAVSPPAPDPNLNHHSVGEGLFWPAPKSPGIPLSAGTPPQRPRVRECGRFSVTGWRVAREARRRLSRRTAASKHTARARDDRNRTGLYEEITDKIIAELRPAESRGSNPGERRRRPLAMPQNAVTRRCHSGINVLILWGYRHRAWLRVKAGSPSAKPSAWVAMFGRASAAQPSSTPIASCPTTNAGEQPRLARKPRRFRSLNASPSSAPTNAKVYWTTSRDRAAAAAGLGSSRRPRR